MPVLTAAIAAATASLPQATPLQPGQTQTAPSAAERVLAAELQGRGETHDALSMMVSSMVRMVQAGRARESRWQDS